MTVNELIKHLQSIVEEDKANGELEVLVNELTAECVILRKEHLEVIDKYLEIF